MNTAGLVGATLRRCEVREHHHGEQRTLLSVVLVLTDGPAPIALSCAADGQSLRIAENPVAPTDMAEYGQIVTSTDHPACRVLQPGARVDDAELLVDADGLPMGLRLRTDAGHQLYVVNWGDSLLAAEELPPHIADVIQAR
jgi:hypothetical protein